MEKTYSVQILETTISELRICHWFLTVADFKDLAVEDSRMRILILKKMGFPPKCSSEAFWELTYWTDHRNMQ